MSTTNRPAPQSGVLLRYLCLRSEQTVGVFRSLRDDGPALVTDLVERLDRSVNGLGLDLRMLRSAGLVESRTYAKFGKSLLWSLTDAGRRVLAELDRS